MVTRRRHRIVMRNGRHYPVVPLLYAAMIGLDEREWADKCATPLKPTVRRTPPKISLVYLQIFYFPRGGGNFFRFWTHLLRSVFMLYGFRSRLHDEYNNIYDIWYKISTAGYAIIHIIMVFFLWINKYQ